jgi:hypothetical protein
VALRGGEGDDTLGGGGMDAIGGEGGGDKDSGDQLPDATAEEINEAFSLDFDDLIGQTD